jgi:hypothetical protein
MIGTCSPWPGLILPWGTNGLEANGRNAPGHNALAKAYCGSLVNAGKTILPVATAGGHTVTALPFCH